MALPPMISRERLGAVGAAIDAAEAELDRRDALARLQAGDHTLWQEDPTEVADRLGWLWVIDELAERTGGLRLFAEAAAADGLRHAVVLGMGGSSLFPEVLNQTFGAGPFDLRVLDTTDPAPIRRVGELELDRCLFVVASKSGTTIETRTQLEYFWAATGGRGEQFVVVTDPGSELAELGRAQGMRAVFENRPDIGGRYSALSYFGLLPGALLGVDLDGLLGRARAVDTATAVRLAAVLGGAARAGRDKLTLVLPPEVTSFGLWLEQLVAESLGKHGLGIVPIVGEPLGPPQVYGEDRLFVSLGADVRLEPLAEAGHPAVELVFRDRLDLGDQVLLWEMAVALTGALLGVNPFDQPDVESAKAAARAGLEGGLAEVEAVPVDRLLEKVGPRDYVVIQAFMDPEDPQVERLESARIAIRDAKQVATSLGIGPRFLHSTGQLHKGGPASGVFLQVLGDDPEDLPIPGRDFTFSQLKQAQAAGDLRALRDRGRRAGRVELADLLQWAP